MTGRCLGGLAKGGLVGEWVGSLSLAVACSGTPTTLVGIGTSDSVDVGEGAEGLGAGSMGWPV